MKRYDIPFSQLDADRRRQLRELSSGAGPEQNLARRWSWQRLLRDLTEDEQTLVYWYYVQDATMVEIAAIMQRSESMVHLLHDRLLAKLRARWPRRHEAAA